MQYRPIEFLFNGSHKGSRYSPRTIEKVVQNAIIKAGLENKNYSVHTIRHSFATHLARNGTDIHTVKELLGHNSLKTTMQYLHVSKKRLDGVVNPFDLLPKSDPNPLKNVAPGSLLHKIRF